MQQTCGPVLSIPPRTRAAPMWPYFYNVFKLVMILNYNLIVEISLDNGTAFVWAIELQLQPSLDVQCWDDGVPTERTSEEWSFPNRQQFQHQHSFSNKIKQVKVMPTITWWSSKNCLLNVWCHVMQLEAVFVSNNVSFSGPGISA